VPTSPTAQSCHGGLRVSRAVAKIVWLLELIAFQAPISTPGWATTRIKSILPGSLTLAMLLVIPVKAGIEVTASKSLL
jgi:hypothetical protein